MSRTDDILDKTKRKEPEAKKWKVIVGITLSLILCTSIYFGILYFSEPIIDDYLENSGGYPSLIYRAYNVYENESADYSNSIFLFGSSLVNAGIRPDKISSELSQHGYDNLTIYNLHISMDTPLLRSLEIQKTIESSPKMVIYGVTYRDVVDTTMHSDERFTLVHDKLEISEDALFLYNQKELELINTEPPADYSKKYLLSALEWAVKKQFTPKTLANASSNTTSPPPVELDIDELEFNADGARSIVWHPEISNERTRYMEALLYNVRTLEDAGIDVVLINMPLTPALSNKISNETRQNFFDLLNDTGANWYDFERAYGYEFFSDLVHASSYGSDLFAPVVADIIIQEMI